jgi:ribonuclease BN (tRNA processing enzyme)
MHIQFLGTGSPTPRLERAGTAIVALFDDAGVLFDCGPGTTLRLVQAGVALPRVTHLLFTHLHFDHCTDYPFFALSRWDQAAGSTVALQVIGPPGIEQFTRRLFGPEGAFAPDIAARRFHPMSQAVWTERGGSLPRPAPELSVQEAPVGYVVRGRAWTIRAGLASHGQPHLECYGYRVETEDRTFVFTGDTGYCASIVELARGADILIHMCAFLDEELLALGVPGIEDVCGSPSVAARVAAEAGVRELVLTHFQSSRLQSPEGQEAAIVAARRIFGGHVRTASDLLVL